ncbi:hypothetical protein DSO57_1024817 [Entomophthora muscae]|uniref:Uncharacterized protein n=1 Tax=Entomophthora muscae TaxID=34485 RepID=A0ACC2SRP8_9FUNG|nr:hypothetical protein DSO57_1024817 [Entomophthora muscae]
MAEDNKNEAGHSEDCIAATMLTGARFALAGFVISAYKNATQIHNAGAFGVFTRTGGDIGYLGVSGLAYQGVACLSESVRGKDDYWNSAIGGAAAGAIIGSRSLRLSPVISTSLAGFFGMALFGVTGSSIYGRYQGETAEQRIQRRKEFFLSADESEQRRHDRLKHIELTKNYLPPAERA